MDDLGGKPTIFGNIPIYFWYIPFKHCDGGIGRQKFTPHFQEFLLLQLAIYFRPNFPISHPPIGGALMVASMPTPAYAGGMFLDLPCKFTVRFGEEDWWNTNLGNESKKGP